MCDVLTKCLRLYMQCENVFYSQTSVSQCRFRDAIVDLGAPSLGIELPRLRRSTASLERVSVEHRAPEKLSHFGTPRTN